MSPHFSKSVKEYLETIEKFGKLIEQNGFPKVWAIIQEWANQEIPASVIAEVLEDIEPFLKTARNKQGYIRQVMKIKHQNYRERAHIKEHEAVKLDYQDLVERLRRV
jgi:hypothetical protein